MKKLIVCALALLILSAASPTLLSAKGDKIKHFGISTLFGAAGESCLHYATDMEGDQRIFFGTVLGTLPGLFKELIDSTKEGNRFSGGDLAADILGSFCGALLSNMINTKLQVNFKAEKNNRSFVVQINYSF